MTGADSTIRATFRKPFTEQVAAFRLRLGNLVPTARWDDLQRNAHDRGFMVAGAMKADLLADLAAAVDKSIAEGTGIAAFRAEFEEIVTRHGWAGWTGDGTERGRAWRTRVIYSTNMRTTMAAGRLAQLRDGNFPFWVYRHSGAVEPRLDHLSWDRVVLAADHPFWVTHYPPNGWGCGCRVRGARSRESARRVGGDPTKPLPDNWQTRDPRTGAPVGIDRGWDYRPGDTVTPEVLGLRRKLDFLPERPSIALIQSWLNHDAFSRWLKDPDGSWPLVRLPKDKARALGSPDKTVADLTAETMRKQLQAHPELRLIDYLQAQNVVDRPTLSFTDDRGGLIFVQSDTSGGYTLVIKATRSGSRLMVTSLRRLSGSGPLREAEIRRLLARSRDLGE